MERLKGGCSLSEVNPIFDFAEGKGEYPVVCKSGGHWVRERMGMTGSSDTGIEDWSFLGVTGYEATVELTEVHQSCFPASALER